MPARYFDDVQIGDELEEHSAPGREDVLQFFTATSGAGRMDPDGIFASEEAARRVGAEGPMVPGGMSFALISRLVTDWAGMEGRLDSLDISFRRPIVHGDGLRLVALVTDTDPAAASVKLDVYMENARGERPLQGTAVVTLPRRGP
ncbi:MAG: hypothetical protein EXR65_01135 [Dehalococcoidia bacterium]|nr:hypothetical protein [Dehalococcoidia bacterium]